VWAQPLKAEWEKFSRLLFSFLFCFSWYSAGLNSLGNVNDLTLAADYFFVGKVVLLLLLLLLLKEKLIGQRIIFWQCP